MSVILQEVQPDTQSWQCPDFSASPQVRLGWIEEQVQEGEAYLSGQRSYVNLAKNMKIFDGIFTDKSRSTLYSNFLKYNIRKFVETLSDVREIGLYGSDAQQYKPYAEIENRVAKAIYLEAQYPRQLRKALQYASVMSVGYIWPKCKATDYGFGERRIVFEPLGILDVLPVQVPATNDVQDAYAVTIYEYMPIAEAHGRFPMFQHLLVPLDRVKHPSRLSAKRLDWAEKFRYGQQSRNWGNLYCEIRYTFVRDLRINNTGHELPMGDADTSWFYKVPSVGQDIFGGVQNGQPFMRPARAEDARVYPNLRLLISAAGVDRPLYDGPAFDWHGQMPAVQYTVDDWPWEALGLSLVETAGSIEQTKRKHERKIDQVMSARLNPPMGYDRTATGGPKIEQFDLFEENIRAGMDGKPRDTFQSLLPEEVSVSAINFEMLEYLTKMEESQLGINDLGSLMNLKANLSSESFDKALEAVGPIAKGIAATMEAANAKVAYMLKWMIPQWMSTRRIIEYIGADNITPEMFDYDPDSLVPSHMIGEYENGLIPMDTMPDGTRVPRGSLYPQLERARAFASQLRLVSVPATLIKLTQQAEQLKMMALYGRGFPISAHTVAKKLGIDNYGEIPGDSEFQKWINEQKLMLVLKAEAAQLAAQLGLGEVPPQVGKQHAGGRPASDQKAPKQVLKDKHGGAPRPVTKTSR